MNGTEALRGPGVAVGRILSPHGTAGLLKVFPHTDFPERCYDLREVTAELRTGRRLLVVERAVLYGRFWLIKFAGIDSREEAANLSGAWLLIRPEERVPLPDGSYYYDQIIGLKVYNAAGELLGRIKEIIPGAAHDLYVIESAAPEGKDYLLPAVKAFVKTIDLAGGRITAEPPEGLTELER